MSTEIIRMGGAIVVKTEPKPIKAPCNENGEVVTVDDDTKLAVCHCRINPEGCWVDEKNMVIQDKYQLIYSN